jgi:hypothetical protein
MKKLIFLILLFSSIKVISQVNYPNAKQHLKEFIAIQSLLAENRMEDLKTFCTNYNYVAEAKNDETLLMKLDEEGTIIENDIQALITVKSGGKDPVSDNYIEILFGRVRNGVVDIYFNFDECKSIENIIQNTYEIGTLYSFLPNNTKYTGVNIEEIDRYNFIISPIKNPDQKRYIKASNFYRNQFIKDNPVCFAGPGKNLGIILKYFEPIKDKVEEKYAYKMRIYSLKLPDAESLEKFNVNFFMSLKNFNDRIWLDR